MTVRLKIQSTQHFPLNQNCTMNKNYQNKGQRIHVMEVAKVLHNMDVKDYKSLTIRSKTSFMVTFDKPKRTERLKKITEC